MENPMAGKEETKPECWVLWSCDVDIYLSSWNVGLSDLGSSASIAINISISYLSQWLNFSIIVRIYNIGNTFSDQKIFVEEDRRLPIISEVHIEAGPTLKIMCPEFAHIQQ